MNATKTYLLGEVDGKVVRIPLELLTSGYVGYTETPDKNNLESGIEGLLAFDDYSMYFYSISQGWRRVPAYDPLYWDDLIPNGVDLGPRFLLVNKEMDLSLSEKANIRSAMGMVPAGQNQIGLVMGSDPATTYGSATITSESRIQVNAATMTTSGTVLVTDTENIEQTGSPIVATKFYVDNAISQAGQISIAPATPNRIGGILSSGDIDVNSNGVPTINKAESVSGSIATKYGLVRFAPNDRWELITTSTQYDSSYIFNIGQIKQYVADNIEPLSLSLVPASYERKGFVKPSGSITVTQDGTIDVALATDNNYGSVKLTYTFDVETQDNNTVPTVQTIKDYVAQFTSQYLTSIPTASATQLGGVKVGIGLTILSGTLAVNQASSSNYGSVLLDTTSTAINLSLTTSSNVPTSPAVKSFVSSYINNNSLTKSNITAADENIWGVVKVKKASGESKTTTPNPSSKSTYEVPTVKYMLANTIQSSLVVLEITSAGTTSLIPSAKAVFSALDMKYAENATGSTIGFAKNKYINNTSTSISLFSIVIPSGTPTTSLPPLECIVYIRNATLSFRASSSTYSFYWLNDTAPTDIPDTTKTKIVKLTLYGTHIVGEYLGYLPFTIS